MDKQTRLRLTTLTAMFAALILITTSYIKIPAPLGYIHVGDSIVYLAASILPGPFGFIAASIGGAAADLLSGYPQWAIPTAIIKALNVLPFFLIKIYLNKSNTDRIINIPNLMMLLPTTLITLTGYFVANTLLYDTGAAFAELLPNLIQAGSSAILFTVIGLSLDSVRFKSKLTLIGKSFK